jgi:ABC-type nitrate/sulfonate/bicarbonate transport system substrate-binding protein
MRDIARVSFPYRSQTHLMLLHVVAGSGAWAKYGLEVNYDFQISMPDAHRAIANREIEFIGGNHISTYGDRARGGKWVYLGQTLNAVHSKLVVRPDSGIDGIADLRGKRVGVRGRHPSLNDWLLLKQRGLDEDRDEVELISQIADMDSVETAHQPNNAAAEERSERKRDPLWRRVQNGKVDAAFLRAPTHLFAADAGLKVIDIEPLPMIWYTTISSGLPFVERHPDIVERFLKGMIEGIYFFKTQPERSTEIIRERYTNEGRLDHAQATYIYRNLAPLLQPKLYPSIAAIANVYEEAKRLDADASKVNPMELWDLYHIRHLDDIGFVDGVYGSQKGDARSAQDQKDPEYLRDQERKQAAVVAAVKASDHLESESGDCH